MSGVLRSLHIKLVLIMVLLVVCIVRSALGMDEDKRSASNTRK